MIGYLTGNLEPEWKWVPLWRAFRRAPSQNSPRPTVDDLAAVLLTVPWIYEDEEKQKQEVARVRAALELVRGKIRHSTVAEVTEAQRRWAAEVDELERRGDHDEARAVRAVAAAARREKIATYSIPDSSVNRTNDSVGTWDAAGYVIAADLIEDASGRSSLRPGGGRPREAHDAVDFLLDFLVDSCGLKAYQAASAGEDLLPLFCGISVDAETLRDRLTRRNRTRRRPVIAAE